MLNTIVVQVFVFSEKTINVNGGVRLILIAIHSNRPTSIIHIFGLKYSHLIIYQLDWFVILYFIHFKRHWSTNVSKTHYEIRRTERTIAVTAARGELQILSTLSALRIRCSIWTFHYHSPIVNTCRHSKVCIST